MPIRKKLKHNNDNFYSVLMYNYNEVAEKEQAPDCSVFLELAFFSLYFCKYFNYCTDYQLKSVIKVFL